MAERSRTDDRPDVASAGVAGAGDASFPDEVERLLASAERCLEGTPSERARTLEVIAGLAPGEPLYDHRVPIERPFAERLGIERDTTGPIYGRHRDELIDADTFTLGHLEWRLGELRHRRAPVVPGAAIDARRVTPCTTS